MILIDTSVWVDYLRGADSRATAELREVLGRTPGEITMCEPVAMELLAGARGAGEAVRVERLTDGLASAQFDAHAGFRQTAKIYRDVRVQGQTVRDLVDCMIATIALDHDLEVAHKDADFEAIAEVTGLRHRDWR